MFSKSLLKTKLKATAVHLSLSVVVFAYLAYKIYYDWYPQPFFEIDGGWQGIRLVGAVDLVLGPLITFLIFDLRKSRKAILFDLLTILVIQLGALAYGVYATYSQRPVAVVLIDEFVVSAIEENYGGKLASAEDLYRYSDERPPIIYAEFPLDRAGIDEVTRIKLEEKVLEVAQLHLYRPFEELVAMIQRFQPRMQALLDRAEAREAYETWLRENGKAASEVYVLRFAGRYGAAWLVFDLGGRKIGYFRGPELAPPEEPDEAAGGQE